MARTRRIIALAACDIVADALFANLARAHAVVRRLAEASEGLASFRARRKPAWYPAAA